MSLAANYILLDAARMSDNIDKALEINKSGKTLYTSKGENMLASVSPYLFSYENKSEMAQWLLENSWGHSWGIYVLYYNDFESLHKHFRKFLLVKTEDGEELYFRFYDPRVLRIFLPTCEEDQLKEFFGPVKAFLMEDEDPEFGLIFTINQNYSLVTQRISKADFDKALTFGVEAVKGDPLPVKEKVILQDQKKDKPLGKKGFSIID